MGTDEGAGGHASKLERALRKKLRRIDAIKARRAEGHALDAQQQEALGREREIRAELERVLGGAEGAPREREVAETPVPPDPPAAAPPGLPPHGARARAEPQRPSAGKKRKREATAAADEACGHCAAVGHRAAECPFGLAAHERYLLCTRVTSPAPCFRRHFVVPLRRCSADFDPGALRAGRADVGMRCASAALFVSQGLRHCTRVSLAFEGRAGAPDAPAEPGARARTLTLSGALVRALRPDEASLGARCRSALDDARGGHASACALAAGVRGHAAYSASELRGFEWAEGGLLSALERALVEPPAAGARARADDGASAPADGASRSGGPADGGSGARAPPPALLVLDGAGEPLHAACARLLATGGARGGVVAVVGDDRGLTADEEEAIGRAAARRGCAVCRVSLGGRTLFASHSIVLLQNGLDSALHTCAPRPTRDYSKATRTTGGGKRAVR